MLDASGKIKLDQKQCCGLAFEIDDWKAGSFDAKFRAKIMLLISFVRKPV